MSNIHTNATPHPQLRVVKKSELQALPIVITVPGACAEGDEDTSWMDGIINSEPSQPAKTSKPDRFELPWIQGRGLTEVLAVLQKTGSNHQPDKRLLQMLTAILDGNPPARRRVAKPATLASLEHLLDTHPNFSAVTRMVLGQVCLMQSRAARPSRLPPVLLAGDAGIGKTSYTAHLANALGVPMQMVSMSSATAGFLLSGLDRGWATGREGRVFAALHTGPVLNPLFLLDELDKAGQQEKSDPTGALYPLLERQTAERFTDEFVGVPVDASYITWVATANDTSLLPAALLSRFKVFHIDPPSRDDMRRVIANQYRQLRQQAPALRPELDATVMASLAGLTPRQSQAALDVAVGNAAHRTLQAGGRRISIERADVLPHLPRESQTFGFL